MSAADPPPIAPGLDSAWAHFQRNETVEAEAQLRELSLRQPAREDVALLLARVLQSQGRFSAASETLLAVCRMHAFEPALSLRCAEFARQCDRHSTAASLCEGALARDTVPPEMLMMAGNVARESGDFKAARAHYLAALDAGIDLERHHVFGALAHTKRYAEPEDVEITRFSRHFVDPRYSVRSRASAGFALAKAQDDLAHYATAAATLRTANAMVHAAQPWDTGMWRTFVAARLHETVTPAGTVPDRGFVPVFIVGMPRTGTTLTAALLARTSWARDRGELRALRYIADQLIGGKHLQDRAALEEAAGLYRKLAVQDDAPATCYLDQDPLNFRYLHIAAAMFPQTKVIHLRRDGRDTALSLWSQDFAHLDLGFAYAFDSMAEYMRGHDALMQHWKRSLRIPIHELDYEALVADPEQALTDLRDFIGAPVRGADAIDVSAPVRSASVWQARQPVYKTSIGRWCHYAPHLPELARFGKLP